MDSVEAVVVGAGVVGLAVGRALAQAGVETLVLERHGSPGTETTSRNSGVIHSGLYYAAGSLKARWCVRGRQLLYAYCEQKQIRYSRCGKIIVASGDQVAALRALYERGRSNGVDDLRLLSAAEVQGLEPEVRCTEGLLSPSTGIVDVHELVLALLADLEAENAMLVKHSSVERIDVRSGGFVLTVRTAGADSELRCKLLVNCAGLAAPNLLTQVDQYPRGLLRTARYAKGSYFACHGARPFRRLVYPMPSEAGLGVHATLDLDGMVRFGPDVEWLDAPDYRVDPARAERFYKAIREYWPGIPPGSLQPAYAGVRPKLVGPGDAAADFVFESEREHGVVGLINLLGIESPGLTSSLAIGEAVARLARA